MTAFVVAIRGLLQQFAPNMVRWDQEEHDGVVFVVGTIIENNAIGNAEDLPKLYYVTTPEGLTLSLNRNVILRSIDRHRARTKATAENAAGPEEPKHSEQQETPNESAAPNEKVVDGSAGNGDEESAAGVDPHTLVPQLAARVVAEGAATMSKADYRSGFQRMARLAWSNLPILNHLRQQYPEKDPLVVYEQLLGEELIEPAGGRYEWVEKFQTYESTHYGHHLAPRIGPSMSTVLQPGDVIDAEVSFDDGGLRARMTMTPAN